MAAQTRRSLFLSAPWFALLRDTIAQEQWQTLRVRSALPSGEAAGGGLVFELMAARAAAGRLAGPLRGLTSCYTPLYGPCLTPALPAGSDLDSGPACMEWSEVRRLNRSGQILLDPLPGEDADTSALRQELREAGHWVDSYFCFGNWYFPTQGVGYAAFMAARPSQLRNTLRRAEAKLAKVPGHAFEMHTEAGPALDEAVEAYLQVYEGSWKPPESQPGFVPALIRMAAHQGWLRLGILRVAGHPVAAQLWFVKDGVASIYKLAYVEGLEPRSMGSVLSARMFEYVLDVDSVEEIDYLNGDEAYKRDWMSHRRVRIGLLALDLRRPKAWWPALRHLAGKLWDRLFGPSRRH